MTARRRPTDDDADLVRLGYAPELSRGMGAFSNFALSFSIICILAGGVTSFHLGYCGVGGAAIGLGWPLGCLFRAGGGDDDGPGRLGVPDGRRAVPLGGDPRRPGLGLGRRLAEPGRPGSRRWRRSTSAPSRSPGGGWQSLVWRWADAGCIATPIAQAVGVAAIVASQAALNHRGVRLVSKLMDLSGYLILIVAAGLTVAMLGFATRLEPGSALDVHQLRGRPAAGSGRRRRAWPRLFALGLLLPLYTMTGFDASAHAAEETVGASANVPRGIVRSVMVAGLAGWAMLAADGGGRARPVGRGGPGRRRLPVRDRWPRSCPRWPLRGPSAWGSRRPCTAADSGR